MVTRRCPPKDGRVKSAQEVVVPKLTIQVNLSEHLMHAYECEAKRSGKRIEELVEKLVNELVREMEREVNDPQGMMS